MGKLAQKHAERRDHMERHRENSTWQRQHRGVAKTASKPPKLQNGLEHVHPPSSLKNQPRGHLITSFSLQDSKTVHVLLKPERLWSFVKQT